MELSEMINKVHCADCLEFMKQIPDKAIDLVLTDPPYGINVGTPVAERERVKVGIGATAFGKSGGKGFVNPKIYRGFDDRQIPVKEVFDEMRRISKNQIIFGGNYFAEYLGNSSCWIVWDKDNAESFFADCELAWTSFPTAIRKFKWRWFGMLQENMGNAKEFRHHPTQKPQALMEWCLQNYSKENDLVLDCFLGSGTTAVACKKLNRRFIGIEISEDYCKIANQRLAQGVLDF
jgi:site-specific DNA-methyltransferase (adenine-specific)